jgi:E3 ubiquitin-protein ligase BAH
MDPSLAEFLKKYFPAEVKAKQKENEEAVAREQFGDLYDAKCAVM